MSRIRINKIYTITKCCLLLLCIVCIIIYSIHTHTQQTHQIWFLEFGKKSISEFTDLQWNYTVKMWLCYCLAKFQPDSANDVKVWSSITVICWGESDGVASFGTNLVTRYLNNRSILLYGTVLLTTAQYVTRSITSGWFLCAAKWLWKLNIVVGVVRFKLAPVQTDMLSGKHHILYYDHNSTKTASSIYTLGLQNFTRLICTFLCSDGSPNVFCLRFWWYGMLPYREWGSICHFTLTK